MSLASYPTYQRVPAEWIGQVPSGWQVRRIGQLFEQRNEKVSDKDYPPLSVTKKGVVPQMQHVAKTDDNDNRKLVLAGDFVINSRSDRKGSSGLSNLDGSVSLINTVLRPKGEIILEFAHYLLRSYAFQEEFYRMGNGLVADLWTTNFGAMKVISVPLPPRGEQQQIVAYLDAETTQIDMLIDRKRRFIELLTEKALAIAAHAVTKGISRCNDIAADAPAWLGQVPSNWRTARIAELFQEIVRPADPNLPVLAVSIHDGVSDKELADEDRARMVNLSEDRTKYQRVQPEDLVYNMMRAWQGAFGTVTVNGLVSPAYVVAKPKAEFRTKFIELQLRTASGAEEVRRYSKGIADFRQRLYWEHFRNLKVCLPPLKEQDDIIAHIESEQARLALLKTKTERSIELLR